MIHSLSSLNCSFSQLQTQIVNSASRKLRWCSDHIAASWSEGYDRAPDYTARTVRALAVSTAYVEAGSLAALGSTGVALAANGALALLFGTAALYGVACGTVATFMTEVITPELLGLAFGVHYAQRWGNLERLDANSDFYDVVKNIGRMTIHGVCGVTGFVVGGILGPVGCGAIFGMMSVYPGIKFGVSLVQEYDRRAISSINTWVKEWAPGEIATARETGEIYGRKFGQYRPVRTLVAGIATPVIACIHLW
jgi:hypothetical protein